MTQDRPEPPARPWYDVVVREIALKGWSKVELSSLSGVARTTIDNWNTNRRKPRAKAVNAVADTLGIDRTRAHILAGIVKADENEIPGEPGISKEMMDSLDRMAPEGDPYREGILDLLRQAVRQQALTGNTGPMPAVPPVEGPGRHRRRRAAG